MQPASTSTTSMPSSSPRVSKFGTKIGFVIPKNKLSGSLVPIARSNSKSEPSVSSKDESTKQTQRKTKWGVDPTQDIAVRKARALAYQVRLDQINRLLASGVFESEDDDHDSNSALHLQSQESSDQQVNKEMNKSKLLELERLEAIGECMRLNPGYKPPPGYKPLLREAKVSIPIKAYPNVNFVSLVFGTQKRLEEETGAKIKLYGIKADAAEKVEINQSDGAKAQSGYQELYVHVSAETYDKVDAAVALIELLVTPASGISAAASALASTDASTGSDQNQSLAAANTEPVASNVLVTAFAPAQGPYQLYPGQWQVPNFSLSPTPSYMIAAPITANTQRFPAFLMNPYNTPIFGGHTPAPAGYSPSARPTTSQLTLQPYNQIGPPQSHMVSSTQPQQPFFLPNTSHLVNQNMFQSASGGLPAGMPTSAPQAPSRPLFIQPPTSRSPATSALVMQRPASLTTQILVQMVGPVPIMSSNTPARRPPFSSHPVAGFPQPQQSSVLGSPAARPTILQHPSLTTMQASGHVQVNVPPSTTAASPRLLFASPVTTLSSSGVQPPPLMRPPSSAIPFPVMQTQPGSLRGPLSGLFIPGSPQAPPPPSHSLAGTTPVLSPASPAPIPLRPSSNDFTFQPQKSQFPTQGVGGPAGMPSPQSIPSRAPPQLPSFRPAVHNAQQVLGVHGAPDLLSVPANQNIRFSHPQTAGNGMLPPRTLPPSRPMSPSLQMGPPSFGSGPQVPLPMRGSVHLQPGAPPPLQGPARSHGGNQVYDPFSPTAVSAGQLRPAMAGVEGRKTENDAEYEDLMASVGVK